MRRTKYRIRRGPPSPSQATPTAAPTDQVAPPASKTCTICRLEKPISEFRLRDKGGTTRHCYCNPCRKAYESDRRIALRHGRIAEFNALLAKHRLDSRAVVQLCHQLFDHFRGIDNFARLWKQHIDVAMRERPGRKYVLDAFSALLALVRVADEYRRQRRPNYDAMTTEELRERLRGLLGINDESLAEEEEEVDA